MSDGIVKPSLGALFNLDHPLAQGLVGCWLFNEGSGNKAYDSSGQQNHGTLINMADPPTTTSGWVPGPHGGALAFNGDSNYVNIGNISKIRTVRIKACATSNSNYRRFFNWGNNGFSAYLQTGTYELRLYYNGTLNITGITLLPNLFYDLILTYDNGTCYIYIDGVYINSFVATINDDAKDFYIGNAIIYGQFWHGLISDGMIYNRALCAEEIAYLYAFSYCMYEEPGYPAWMVPNNIPVFMNHYRRLAA